MVAVLKGKQTPRYHSIYPSPLSEPGLAVIGTWHAKARPEEHDKIGDAVAAAQGNSTLHKPRPTRTKW